MSKTHTHTQPNFSSFFTLLNSRQSLQKTNLLDATRLTVPEGVGHVHVISTPSPLPPRETSQFFVVRGVIWCVTVGRTVVECESMKRGVGIKTQVFHRYVIGTNPRKLLVKRRGYWL